jgi:hypothetical protein
MSGALVAVLVLATWSLWPSSPAAPVPAPTAAAPGAAQQARSGAAGVAEVKLDALSAEREPPSDTPRNPFRYQPKALPPPVKSLAPPPPSNVSAEPPRPTAPPGPAPPPPIPLKFIGTLKRANGVEWAALTDGKNVSYGREGDIVDGRYRIVEIGAESIVLTYVDGRGRQVVRLTGQLMDCRLRIAEC